MRYPKYIVNLNEEERCELESLLRKGKSSARTQLRARILLKADEEMLIKNTKEALDVSDTTIRNVRQRFVEEGLHAALYDKTSPGKSPKLSDKQCAHVIAMACSTAPDGHDHWTLRLLADKVVELGFVESITHESIRQVLKKTTLNRGKVSSGASRK